MRYICQEKMLTGIYAETGLMNEYNTRKASAQWSWEWTAWESTKE